MNAIFKRIGMLMSLAIILFVVVKAFRAKGETEKECEKEKKMHFAGVVRTIESDNVNRAQKTIILTNGSIIEQTYSYGLWNELKAGDSIVKKNGSLNYVIYEGPDFKTSKSLNWDKPCK